MPTMTPAAPRKACRKARRRSCRTAPVRRTARRPAADWRPRESSPAAPPFPATAERGYRGGGGICGGWSVCQRESGDLQGWNFAEIDIPFGMPQIMLGLHPNPSPSAAAKQLTYPHGNFRRNRSPLFHDVTELPGDAEQASNLAFRFASCGEHILPNYSAGMRRAAIRISPGFVLSHAILLPGTGRVRLEIHLFD